MIVRKERGIPGEHRQAFDDDKQPVGEGREWCDQGDAALYLNLFVFYVQESYIAARHESNKTLQLAKRAVRHVAAKALPSFKAGQDAQLETIQTDFGFWTDVVFVIYFKLC